jgi:hypothetical protein
MEHHPAPLLRLNVDARRGRWHIKQCHKWLERESRARMRVNQVRTRKQQDLCADEFEILFPGAFDRPQRDGRVEGCQASLIRDRQSE